jgi:hypothetical protein
MQNHSDLSKNQYRHAVSDNEEQYYSVVYYTAA